MSDEAREAEANGDEVSFEFKGIRFTVPREQKDWPLDLIEAISDQADDVGILRGALGPAQWSVVKKLNLVGSDVTEMTRLLLRSFGMSQGESAPSGS